MVLRATEIGDILRAQIAGFEKELTVSNVGTVVEVGDGIARVYGLSQVMASELVEFTKNGVLGLAFNLEEDSVGVIILGEYTASKRATRSARPAASPRCRSARP